MDDKLTQKTVEFIGDVINSSNPQKLSFYDDVTAGVCKLFGTYVKDLNAAVFLLEDCGYILKSGNLKNYKKTNAGLFSFFDDFIKKEDLCISLKLDDTNCLITKLNINKSVFGFMVLSSVSRLDKVIEKNFIAVSNVLSYKIKDYELSLVYKMQLNALQEAIQDKENANLIIKKQHKKLEKLDKTKNLFLANISHELRTPLNAIIGFSQALDARIFGDLNEKQAEYIKDIQISGLHLLGMINEILDISKLEANAMKFSPCEISSAASIREVVNILEPLYKNKQIDLIFDAQKNYQILADNQKFQQILYNLLSNSIKFTPKNGKIYINQDSVDKNYILEIKDTGIGVDKKYHNKIFKKYVHLSHDGVISQNSTGLGLPITKELVKLHKGKITLVSEPNKGASFKMEFKNLIV